MAAPRGADCFEGWRALFSEPQAFAELAAAPGGYLMRYIVGPMADAGALIRERRRAHRLTQAQLARRAGTTQAALSRLERGELSPTLATLERLLAALGEVLEIATRRPELDTDLAHLRDLRRRSPAERLELAISWNRLAGELAKAGREARR